jgi:hypothetical protein
MAALIACRIFNFSIEGGSEIGVCDARTRNQSIKTRDEGWNTPLAAKAIGITADCGNVT